MAKNQTEQEGNGKRGRKAMTPAEKAAAEQRKGTRAAVEARGLALLWQEGDRDTVLERVTRGVPGARQLVTLVGATCAALASDGGAEAVREFAQALRKGDTAAG